MAQAQATLLVNRAQCALKAAPAPDLARARADCTAALALTPVDAATRVKAYYRRALASPGDDDAAQADLEHALAFDPANAAVKQEVARLATKRAAAREQQKKLYAKMFG